MPSASALRHREEPTSDVDNDPVGAHQVFPRPISDRAPLVFDHHQVLRRERNHARVVELTLEHRVESVIVVLALQGEICAGLVEREGVAAVLEVVQLLVSESTTCPTKAEVILGAASSIGIRMFVENTPGVERPALGKQGITTWAADAATEPFGS